MFTKEVGRFGILHWRGHCRCGRVLVVHTGLKSDPDICECHRRWYMGGETPTELVRVVPALCLDLDGTVRCSKSRAIWGPQNPGDVELLPNVEKVIAEYKARGFAIVGVTNQGPVAYGTRTEVEIEAITEATRQAFAVDPFDLILASYSYEKGSVPGRNVRSLLRKPHYGMLALAEVRMREEGTVIDWTTSIMVGDMESDQGCAEDAGVTFAWARDFFGWEK